MIIKQQLDSFSNIGFLIKFNAVINKNFRCFPDILVCNEFETYRFDDPDWAQVSKKLACLYMRMKRSNRVKVSESKIIC
jgi:hypothetical protein